MNKTEEINEQSKVFHKDALYIDGDYFAKFVFTKNPFDIDANIKEINSVCEILKRQFQNVTVVFNGLFRNHKDIINHKNKLIYYFDKNVRKPNPKMLHSQSSYMLSYELQKLGFTVLFTNEMNVQETIYQCALNSNFRWIGILTSYEHVKTEKSNIDFSQRISFYDRLILDQNDRKKPVIKLKSSLKYQDGKYYVKLGNDNRKNVDDETINNFDKKIDKKEIPKTFNNYRDVVITNLTSSMTIILGNSQFYLKELSNPHIILSKLRQALYHKLKISSVIEEILVYKNDRYYFIPNLVEIDVNTPNPDHEKIINQTPNQIFKLLFANLEKNKNMLFSEFNNHVCSIYTEICYLLSIANNQPFNFYFKTESAKKISPEDKVIIKKNCMTCKEEFVKKESELEIYIVKDLKYPETCQKCIDERAKEKRELEEYTKKIKEINSKEAIEKREKEKKEKEEKDRLDKEEKERLEKEEKRKKEELEKKMIEEKEKQMAAEKKMQLEKEIKNKKEQEEKDKLNNTKVDSNKQTDKVNTTSTGRWKKN